MYLKESTELGVAGRRSRDAASPVQTPVPPAGNHHLHPGGSPRHFPGSPGTSPSSTKRPQRGPTPTYAKGTITFYLAVPSLIP